MTKRMLIVITEGPTDLEFYKKVISTIKDKHQLTRFNFDEIKYMCAEGIANMHKKMLGKFTKEICGNNKYSSYDKFVCLCYDLDVFKQTQQNPPIDRVVMRQDFEKAGAKKIIEIIADDMIEDFFLMDTEGLKDFLKLKKRYKIPAGYKSLGLIKKIFKDGNRIYSKGTKVEGLVNSLNIELIMKNICTQLQPLCSELTKGCSGDKC